MTTGTLPGVIKVASENINASAITPAKLSDTAQGSSGNKNIIINGAMQVSERATSATNPGGGYATLDRYRMSQNSSGLGNFVMAQQTDGPGGTTGLVKCLKLTKDGATTMGSGNSAYIHYTAEGQDVQHLCYGSSDAKQVTISFWVKSSVAGTYGLSLGDGAASRGSVQTYAINATNTWEYKSVTFVGDTGAAIPNDNTAGFSIHWVLGAGTDYHETSTNTWTATHKLSTSSQTQWTQTDAATFFLTGCQAEVGDTATAFEHESFYTTLRKCQRYFQKQTYPSGTYVNVCYAYDTGSSRASHKYLPKLKSPTITTSGGPMQVYHSAGNLDDSTQQYHDLGTESCRLTVTLTGESTTAGYAMATYTTSSTYNIFVDAEL